MKRNASFWRKVGYIVVMGALLVPLSWLSAPATTKESGGKLSQMRQEHRLSQAQLGEIDPASASMSLATLGLGHVATNLLWSQYLDYKKKEDWDNMKATLNQISKLQPNFVAVWRFQAWDLTYNTSVEFDNYRHRYEWVKKGVDFLLKGIRFNRDEPSLLWELGWFFGHKFGRADEQVQFRRLYRGDDDFHATLPIDIELTRGPDGRPDNWLTARQWYLQAQRVVDTKNAPIKGMGRGVFHAHPALASVYYAIATENDGYLDEHAHVAWMNAGQDWNDYGVRRIRTSDGRYIRMNDMETLLQEEKSMRKKLDELAPGVREQLAAERRAKLTRLEQDALNTPIPDRNRELHELALGAEGKLRVADREVAEQAPDELRSEAIKIALRVTELDAVVQVIDNYRDQVNYDYWTTRCQAEQTDTAIRARRLIYEAEKAYEQAKLEEARRKFEEAWDQWAIVYDQYPSLMDDVSAEDLVDTMDQYRELLGHFEEEFPPPGFKLEKLLRLHGKNYQSASGDGRKTNDAASKQSTPTAEGSGVKVREP